jgi:hypothetical protein
MNKIKQLIQNSFFGSNVKPTVFFEVDSDFIDLYNLAQEKTGMRLTDNLLRRQRHYTLTQLLRNVMPLTVNTDIAECGCWKGLSAYQLAYLLKIENFKNKFYLFDSFEGLSEFKDEDLKDNKVSSPEKRKKEFACSLSIVKDNLREYSFIEYKKGWIPEKFKDVEETSFSFVHIDVDLYQPIKDSLEFFYPKIIKGGVIVLDDYGYLTFPGAKQAVDEFVKGKSDFFMSLPSGAAFIVKG